MNKPLIDFLKMQLLHFQACERFFQAPIDLDPIKNRLEALEQEDIEGGQSGQGASHSYLDFLLPLPEHLQPTEIGMPDPNVIAQRRQEKGMNEPLRAQEKNIRNELKARNELKNQMKHKMAPKPQPKAEYTKKFKIAPRPGGYSKNSDEAGG